VTAQSTATSMPVAEARSRRHRAVDAAIRRLLKLRGPTTDYTVSRDLRIPTRDGVQLLADHYAPVGAAAGTMLVRSPYGFDPLFAALIGSPYAASGYHVVLARCRGTFGSGGGVFEPMLHEINDAADTIAWLRKQSWFGGRFATVGFSYLGFTQWAMLMDPPPELAAAVITAAHHDISRAMYFGGAFNLNDALGWTDLIAHQEQFGFLRGLARTVTAARRERPAMSSLPLADAADGLCQGRAPWYREWVSHRDRTNPYWSRMQLGAALDRVQRPVLLQTGWQDVMLPQTLEQYTHLHRRGLDVALTIGPWTHLDTIGKAAGRLTRESLDWLAEHLAGTGSRMRWAAVRVYVTGAQEWRDLPEWPPPATERVLYLRSGGVLHDQPAPTAAAPASFTYDPADPTPTVGGRLFTPTAGYRNDSALALRRDVLAFTGAQLPAALDVVGVPVVELAHSSDNAHADLFVRISEVDPKGRSRNVSDGFVRLDPDRTETIVRLELDAIAHRFTAGNRIRLLIAGGSFPRWERNLGTGEDPAKSSRMAPSRRTIDMSASRVLLPVRA
jgi:putative CocE/NonD family hydrolase